MELMKENKREKGITRRGFLGLMGMIGFWFGFLVKFIKNFKSTIGSFLVSHHPAQFYRKLD